MNYDDFMLLKISEGNYIIGKAHSLFISVVLSGSCCKYLSQKMSLFTPIYALFGWQNARCLLFVNSRVLP